MKEHKRKLIVSLMTLVVVFSLIFVFALINFNNDRAFLNIGLKPHVENMIIMAFSILSIINVIYELKVV